MSGQLEKKVGKCSVLHSIYIRPPAHNPPYLTVAQLLRHYMVFGYVAQYFSGSSTPITPATSASQSKSSNTAPAIPSPIPALSQYQHESTNTNAPKSMTGRLGYLDVNDTAEQELGEPRPEYRHAMLAGGLGGLTGDMLMHSLDTVKTRQQGDPHRPPKYRQLTPSYLSIYRQEGVLRGLYGGAIPAAVGSFAGTFCFFGAYEYSKRWMIDAGISPGVSYLAAGLVADAVASPVYVPTEVIKTRLQLQGRHNNPFFHSGYNYHGTGDALRTILRTEGFGALFHGYKATLYRDLPFSALQFAFYEQERDWAKQFRGQKDIGLGLEILTGMTAGGMAGTITCPLDVVKTRIQTQLPAGMREMKNTASTAAKQHSATTTKTPQHRPSTSSPLSSTLTSAAQSRRTISTSSPSTSLPHATSHTLPSSSVVRGLHFIYQTEGMAGLFRGVGPRAVWTSVQSGTMLVLYQTLLQYFEDGKEDLV